MRTSRTTTTTERPLYVRLQRPQKIDENAVKLQSVLAGLKEACKRLPSPHHNEISSDIALWESEFAECKAGQDPVIDSANALCFLCFNTVEYIMLFVAPEENQAQWLLAWNELQDIAKKTLPEGQTFPEGQNAVQFMETYKQRLANLLSLPEKIENIRVLFQRHRGKLYNQANQKLQLLVGAFENFKNDFSEFQEDKERSTKVVREFVDSVMQIQIQLITEFGENLIEVQDLENEVEEQENISEQNFNDILNLIAKV